MLAATKKERKKEITQFAHTHNNTSLQGKIVRRKLNQQTASTSASAKDQAYNSWSLARAATAESKISCALFLATTEHLRHSERSAALIPSTVVFCVCILFVCLEQFLSERVWAIGCSRTTRANESVELSQFNWLPFLCFCYSSFVCKPHKWDSLCAVR